ncbi:hypothetical protein KIPB_014108, partial [Kipferlia bialata]
VLNNGSDGDILTVTRLGKSLIATNQNGATKSIQGCEPGSDLTIKLKISYGDVEMV